MKYKQLKKVVKEILSETVVEKTINRLDQVVAELTAATTLDEFVRKMDDTAVNSVLDQIIQDYDLRTKNIEEEKEDNIGMPTATTAIPVPSPGSTEGEDRNDDDIAESTLNEKVEKLKAKYGKDWKKVVKGMSENIAAKKKEPKLAEGGLHGNALEEFSIPEWAASALVNGDYSGLSDEDELKIKEFVKGVVDEYGNANFSPAPDDEFELGFKHGNDIDNLGANCVKLVILSSK